MGEKFDLDKLEFEDISDEPRNDISSQEEAVSFSVKIIDVLDAKMRAVEATGADVVATANPGCLLHLQYGVVRQQLDARVRYVTDLLAEAYSLE